MSQVFACGIKDGYHPLKKNVLLNNFNLIFTCSDTNECLEICGYNKAVWVKQFKYDNLNFFRDEVFYEIQGIEDYDDYLIDIEDFLKRNNCNKLIYLNNECFEVMNKYIFKYIDSCKHIEQIKNNSICFDSLFGSVSKYDLVNNIFENEITKNINEYKNSKDRFYEKCDDEDLLKNKKKFYSSKMVKHKIILHRFKIGRRRCYIFMDCISLKYTWGKILKSLEDVSNKIIEKSNKIQYELDNYLKGD